MDYDFSNWLRVHAIVVFQTAQKIDFTTKVSLSTIQNEEKEQHNWACTCAGRPQTGSSCECESPSCWPADPQPSSPAHCPWRQTVAVIHVVFLCVQKHYSNSSIDKRHKIKIFSFEKQTYKRFIKECYL